MDLCSSTLMKAVPSLKFAEKIARTMEVCRGLAFLHKIGVVHGDLKPSNIVISNQGIAKLSEFGLNGNASVNGGMIRYLAPETSLEDDVRLLIDPKFSDMYSLGGVIVFILNETKVLNDWKGSMGWENTTVHCTKPSSGFKVSAN
jgi:serine/threonine protein kinase